MPSIVLSYRRKDSAGTAGRIFDKLVSRFGSEHVFMDIDNIPLGVDYREHIEGILARTGVLLAIIGPRWLGDDGQQQIDEETDLIRIEIQTAIKNGIPLIPVIVDYASMPSSRQLPDSIKALAFRNAAEVAPGRDFHVHMDRLIRSIEAILPDTPSASASTDASVTSRLGQSDAEGPAKTIFSNATKTDSVVHGDYPDVSRQGKSFILSESAEPIRLRQSWLRNISNERPILLITISAVVSGLSSHVALSYAGQFLTFSVFGALGLQKGPGITVLPGVFFGLVICACNYRFGVQKWFSLMVVFVISTGSWVIACDSGANVYDALSQFTTTPTETKEQEPQGEATPITSVGRLPFLAGFCGLIGGFVGGLGIILATWTTNPTFRHQQSWVIPLFAATLFGAVLQLSDSNLGSLALFLTWQPAVAASIVRELAKSAGSGLRNQR